MAELSQVVVGVAGPIVGEAGGQQAGAQLGCGRDVQPAFVAPGALAALRPEQVVAQRVVGHAQLRSVRPPTAPG